MFCAQYDYEHLLYEQVVVNKLNSLCQSLNSFSVCSEAKRVYTKKTTIIYNVYCHIIVVVQI